MAKIGEKVGGVYLVHTLLGEGGTSKVWLVVDERDQKRYALKEIPLTKAKKAGVSLQIRTKERMRHPSLVSVCHAFEEDGMLYLLMDYVSGRCLDEVLDEGGAMQQDQAVDVAMQLCKALVYLHGFHPPVIYRDMKPANVILQPDGKVKLIDLGAARVLRSRWRRDTVPLGTLGYAAPEQFGKRGRSDQRSDIYALGVTLYHMLTGHDPGEPPYRIGRIREWNKDLPGELEKIVAKCTNRHPFARFQSAEAVLRALEGYQEKERNSLKRKIRRHLEKFS